MNQCLIVFCAISETLETPHQEVALTEQSISPLAGKQEKTDSGCIVSFFDQRPCTLVCV